MADLGDYASGAGLRILGARRSDAGSLIFLQNKSNDETTATFKDRRNSQDAATRDLPFPRGCESDGWGDACLGDIAGPCCRAPWRRDHSDRLWKPGEERPPQSGDDFGFFWQYQLCCDNDRG